jgi:hypothetical protein
VPQPTTEITVLGGDRYRVEGEPRDVERLILGAARGSLMELAWLVEVETGEPIAVNPECVVMLRATGSPGAARAPDRKRSVGDDRLSGGLGHVDTGAE